MYAALGTGALQRGHGTHEACNGKGRQVTPGGPLIECDLVGLGGLQDDPDGDLQVGRACDSPSRHQFCSIVLPTVLREPEPADDAGATPGVTPRRDQPLDGAAEMAGREVSAALGHHQGLMPQELTHSVQVLAGHD